MIQVLKSLSPRNWFEIAGYTLAYVLFLMIFLKEVDHFQDKILFILVLLILYLLFIMMDWLIKTDKITYFKVMLYYPFLFYTLQFFINLFTHVKDFYTMPLVASLFTILQHTIKQKEAPDTLGWPKTWVLLIYFCMLIYITFV